jgi:DNA-binding PadR family transcriptional regulator
VAWADPALLIMGSLAGGAKHGYAIQQDVLADAGVELGPGTLYGALARLERDGLVEPLPGEARRRPYRLTGAGVAVLEERVEQLRHFTRTTARRLRVRPA